MKKSLPAPNFSANHVSTFFVAVKSLFDNFALAFASSSHLSFIANMAWISSSLISFTLGVSSAGFKLASFAARI